MDKLSDGAAAPARLTFPHASTAATEVEAKLVVDRNDQGTMLRLRHDAYAAVGYLRQTASSIFADRYDGLPTSRSLLLYRGGRPAASVRVCLRATDAAGGVRFGLPAEEIFADEIGSYMASEPVAHRAVEITRLSRHPDFSRDTALMLALFRMAGYLILGFRAETIFAAITPSHVPFYRRMGFSLVGPARDYPGLDVQTVLVACPTGRHMTMRGQLSALGTLSLDDPTYQIGRAHV